MFRPLGTIIGKGNKLSLEVKVSPKLTIPEFHYIHIYYKLIAGFVERQLEQSCGMEARIIVAVTNFFSHKFCCHVIKEELFPVH